ncbi:MAG: class I SAM-dependent methyltransferase [Vicinamibacterales bacterium]
MSTELAEWLRLREAADHATRSPELTGAITGALRGRDHVRILDLATGTGSNLRYLVPRLPSSQEWLVVDRSRELLDQLIIRTTVWAVHAGHDVETSEQGLLIHGSTFRCRVTTLALDLDTLDAAALAGDYDLITASALLDLVSTGWLERLATLARHAGAHALFPINYDGRSSCEPPEPEDERIRDSLNAHQHRDKGLGGPAAGPEAGEAARSAFAAQGYDVHVRPADWHLDASHAAMQRVLVDGWAAAALELTPGDRAVIEDWHARRLAHIDAGRSRLTVGHLDVAAVHPGR